MATHKATQTHYSKDGKISSCGSSRNKAALTDSYNLVTCSRCMATKQYQKAAFGFGELREGEKEVTMAELEAAERRPVEIVSLPEATAIEAKGITVPASERNAFELTRELLAFRNEYFEKIATATAMSDGEIPQEMFWIYRSLLGPITYQEFLTWLKASK